MPKQAVFGVPAGVHLGNSAKSQSIVDLQGDFSGSVDSETGEILGGARDPVAVRLERYGLQSVARSILPDSRTARCLRVRRGGVDHIEVLRTAATRSAVYRGLQTCGSVWACPVCAAKISERRRVDLLAGIAAHQAAGGVVLLLTLTHPHTRADRLADLLAGEQRALSRFFGSRKAQELWADLGRVGHVRSWEVTHGRLRPVSFGWHPHFHILLFLDRDPGGHLCDWEERLFVVWANACRLGGLDAPSRFHGVKLDDGAKAGAYVAKIGLEDTAGSAWGLDAEMTKGHIKRSKDGETPFDLLRAVFVDRSDDQARSLVREYAAAFHGKRQLVWSRGLRERLGLDADSTDDEVAAMTDEGAEVLGRLDAEEWRLVLRFDVRGELLELARHGWDPVRRLLDGLVAKAGA